MATGTTAGQRPIFAIVLVPWPGHRRWRWRERGPLHPSAHEERAHGRTEGARTRQRGVSRPRPSARRRTQAAEKSTSAVGATLPLRPGAAPSSSTRWYATDCSGMTGKPHPGMSSVVCACRRRAPRRSAHQRAVQGRADALLRLRAGDHQPSDPPLGEQLRQVLAPHDHLHNKQSRTSVSRTCHAGCRTDLPARAQHGRPRWRPYRRPYRRQCARHRPARRRRSVTALPHQADATGRHRQAERTSPEPDEPK